MADAPHIVGKILFQVRLPDRDRAELYFGRISRFCHDELPALLNRLLDDARCPPDIHIRIDRLVLNAGILSEQEFEAGLLRNLEQELRRSLRLAMQTPLAQAPSKTAPLLEILEYFFQHGRFPWWASREMLPDMSPETLWEQALKEHRQEAVKLLKRTLGQPAARERLLRQLSPAILVYSTGLLPEKQASWLNKRLASRGPYATAGQAAGTPSPEQAEKQLLYFLETGRLPDGAERGKLDLEQTLRALLRRPPGRLRQIMLELSRKTDLAARLAAQCSAETLIKLLESLWPGLAPEWRRQMGEIQPALEKLYPGKDVKTLLWSAALNVAWTNPAEQSGAGAPVKSILTRLAADLKVPESALLQQLETLTKGTAPFAEPSAKPATSTTSTISTRDEDRLFRFLETGHLPAGDNNSAGLEQTLLAFLRRSPGQLRQILLDISRKTDLSARLASQFSAETLTVLLIALMPGLPDALLQQINELQKGLEEAYPENDVKSLLWSAVLDFIWIYGEAPTGAGAMIKAILTGISTPLKVPEYALLQRLRAVLPGTALMKDLTEIREALPEGIPGNVIPLAQAPVPPLLPTGSDTTEQLFYFLEWSRLPAGATAVPPDWEPFFLALLRQSPYRVRQRLLDINRKLNLASRIIRHFGLPVQQEVLHALFPEQWSELETVLSDLTQLLPAPGKDNAGNRAWATALEWLLAHPAGPPDMPALVTFLVEQFEIRPDSLQQSAIRRRKAPGQSATWKYLQMTFSTLTETELADIQTDIAQWQADESGRPAPASGAADRLTYRLAQGRPAWWDDAPLSDEQLFEQLAALPPAELRTALTQLWPAALRKQWLPALSPGSFERLLQVFWGDYAGQATIYIDTFRAIAAEMRFNLDLTALRETFLEAALKPGLVVRSDSLFHIGLRLALGASPWTAAQWKAAVEARATTAIAGGDIRFHRVREVLQEPDDFPPPDWTEKEIPPAPSIPAETSARPGYAQILRGELQAIWQFLRYGTVPPAAGVPSAGAMEHIFLRLIEKHPALLRRVLSDNLDRSGAVERLIRHFSPKTWRALATLLWRPHFDHILGWWRELAGRLDRAGPDSDPNRLERHFFTFLLQQANRAATGVYEPASLLHELIRFIAGIENMPETLIWAQIKTAKPGAPPATLDLLLDTPEQQPEQVAPLPEPKRRRLLPDTPAPLAEETIAVHNAGLVILAPYLGRFFGTLNMLDGDVFKDDNAADRGVHLLQYMATRQTETPEHLLVLNKVLCGLPIGTPVSAGITLGAEEENLCNFLLNTVLQNWEIMKNSSVANLQGAFILRDGLLREGMDRWQLNVEKKAFDIVLDYLPWTISMVKLPWMEKRIEVEWKKKS